MGPVFNELQKSVKAQRWGRLMPLSLGTERPGNSSDSKAEDVEEDEDAGSVGVEPPSPPIYYDDDEDENVVNAESEAESHPIHDDHDADEDEAENENAMTAEMEAQSRSIDDDHDESEDTVMIPVQSRSIYDGVNQSEHEAEEAHVQEGPTAIEPQSCSVYNGDAEHPEDKIRVSLPYSPAAAATTTPAPPVPCLYNNWNAQPIFMINNIPCDHPPTIPTGTGRAVPFDAFSPLRSNARNQSPGGISVPGLTNGGQFSPSNNTSGPSSFPDYPEQFWIEDVEKEEEEKEEEEEERERQAWLKTMPLFWRLVNESVPDDTHLWERELPLDLNRDLWTDEQRIAVRRYVGQGLWDAIGREVGR